MGNPVDREGNFRVEITDYGMREAKAPSKSVGVTLKCRLLEIYDFDSEQWHAWAEYDQEADGAIWIVGKDGDLNDKAVESLVVNAGWDGTIESIVEKTWKPTACQITTSENVYNGKTTFQIGFVNHYDSKPGGMGAVSSEKAKQLSQKYGSSLRAVVGTMQTNSSAAPKGKPPAPKPKAPQPVGAIANGAPPADEVPF